MGRVGAPHGVRGWVRVVPFTESPDALLAHARWLLGSEGTWTPRRVLEGRVQGTLLVIHVEGVDDRDAARELTGQHVALPRDALPPAGDGEYYWCDLEGLSVSTVEGVELGTVTRLMETGANDVMVVSGERERLLPFLQGSVVKDVDLAAGRITVDWDPEF